MFARVHCALASETPARKMVNNDKKQNILGCVSAFHFKHRWACKIAKQNLAAVPKRMKSWFNKKKKKKAKARWQGVSFHAHFQYKSVGTLQQHFCSGEKKFCDTYDFIAMFYCKWRTRLCHIKMLKPYFDQWFVWFKLSRQSKNCFDVFFSPPTCMWCAGISTGMPVAADNKIGDADGPSMALVQGNWHNS